MRLAQGLCFAFVEMAGGGGVDGIMAVGMHLHVGLYEGSDVGRARARTICRCFSQHRLWHMDGIEHGDEQLQMPATGQCDQRPGIGDDDGPTHRAASKAASSCSSSAGS